MSKMIFYQWTNDETTSVGEDGRSIDGWEDASTVGVKGRNTQLSFLFPLGLGSVGSFFYIILCRRGKFTGKSTAVQIEVEKRGGSRRLKLREGSNCGSSYFGSKMGRRSIIKQL